MASRRLRTGRRSQSSDRSLSPRSARPADPPTDLSVSHQGWDMTKAASGCGGGSSRDRTPRWTTLMWRKTISPGPLPCTGSSQLVGLVLYPEPTDQCDQVVLVVELGEASTLSALSGRKAMRSDNFKSGAGGGTGRGQAGILSTLSGRRTMRSDHFKSY